MTLTRFVRSFVSHNPATTEIYTLSLHDALPISRTSVVISRFLFVMTITSLQVLVILGVAYLFGVHPVTGLPGVAVIILIGLLFGVGLTAISMALAFSV